MSVVAAEKIPRRGIRIGELALGLSGTHWGDDDIKGS
jgi:hypothetical protein